LKYVTYTFAIAALIALAAPGDAAAQDFVRPDATQLRLYEEGAEAFRQGQYEKAVELFQASLHLGQLNITWLNLGRALFKLGRCAEALDAYQAAMSAPHVEAPTPAQVRAKMEEYRADLQQSCPGSLIIECRPEDRGELLISIDGQPPLRCSADPILLPPGTHKVIGRADGLDPMEHEVTIAPMGQARLTMLPTTDAQPQVRLPGAAPAASDGLGLLLGVRVGTAVSQSGNYSVQGELDGLTFQDGGPFTSDPGVHLNAYAEFELLSFLAVGGGFWYFGDFKPVVSVDDNTQITNAFNALDLNAHLALRIPSPGFSYQLMVGGGVSTLSPKDPPEGEDVDSAQGYNLLVGAGGALRAGSFLVTFDTVYQYYRVSRETRQDVLRVNETIDGTRIMINLGLALRL
jgi:hypothetical protein